MADQPMVVVGASLAGLRAVEAARKTGYAGRLILVGAEEHLPYDRPPLSKAFLDAGESEPEPTTFKTEAELAELDVELRLGCPATGLELEAKEVALGSDSLPYSALVIATGAHARPLPGDHPAGLHHLRTVDDAREIRRALEAGPRKVVVVGGGFIGSEVASAARKRDHQVTIVEMAPMPLIKAVGDRMAAACAGLHARNGTELRCGVGVDRVEGDDHVERVVLSDGSALDADLVVVGTGAVPTTDWLEGSGLSLDDGIVCDETLAAGASAVFAGDVARWTNPLFGEQMRLEHWTSAAEQGARAARNALDPDLASAYSTVPYFWSDRYSDRLQMVGVAGADEVRVVGDVEDDKWLALYRRGDLLTGTLALNMQGKIMKYRAMIKRQTPWNEALSFAGIQ